MNIVLPEFVFVFNFNKRFTGVSATIAAVTPLTAMRINTYLVGYQLPGCPPPISLFRAIRIILEKRANLSVCHVRRNSEMLAGILARDVLRLPIKLVFTSAAQRKHSAFPRWLISKMNAVIATSKAAASFVDKVVAVIPHGVDCQRFSPAKSRSDVWQKLGWGGNHGIATIGRIRPEKGTDLFVETMINVLPELPGHVALIVGAAKEPHTSFLANLREKVKSAGLTDRIIFTGEIPYDQIPDLVKGLSLLVALPRYEGFGLTPLEAMASAVPFVATDAGAFLEFSNHGKAGVVVPQENAVKNASHAIKALLSNKTDYEAFAQNAQIVASTKFSVQQEADEILAVYSALGSIEK